ncbi:SDR family oxidoreductase [Isoptericola aurantiacus]|uniref:SDR family oxidoreductase n=1 Tax=Isoptericola aurantiacus TaxID=3377839 RepID=UPI00383B7827
MRIFMTGASGWIGSAVVPELLASGHEVVGLARSEAAATRLRTLGVTAHPGSLEDVDSLRSGARSADGVVHLAFGHDFTRYAEAGRTERAVVTALGAELAGSERALVIAAGIFPVGTGRPLTEDDRLPQSGPDTARGGSEQVALDLAERGVRSVSVRLAPTVHGPGDQGFTSMLVDIAHQQGAALYPGAGANRWTAVHRLDAARVVARALDAATAGSAVHAVAEESVTTREIAETIGHRFGLPTASFPPEEATERLGFAGNLLTLDAPASSGRTRASLGWTPREPGLLEDISSGAYDPPTA